MARAIDTMPTFSNKKNTQTTSGTTAQTTRAVDAMPTFTGKTVSVTTADTSKSGGNLDTMPTFSGKTTTPTAAQTEDDGVTGRWNRIKNTTSGAVKAMGASYTNLLGLFSELGQNGRTARNSEYQSEYAHDLERAKYDMEAMLEANREAPGTWSSADIQSQQYIIDDLQKKYDAMSKVVNEKVEQKTTEADYALADRIQESAAKDTEKAKEGLGAVGQLAVELGTQGVQMASDTAANVLLPGAGLLMMGARSAGSSAQDARQSGASFGQQLAYGLGSGAVSIATEKLSNIASPFKKAFGGGVLDEALSKAVSKMTGNAAGKVVLSMLSEGGEEIVEDLVQPILQRMTYNKEALGQYGDADYWAQLLYDGLVGAAMGGIGSGVEAVQNRITGQKAAGNAVGAQTAAQESNVTAPTQNAAEGAQTASQAGIMEREAARLFGQNNTAPETGTAESIRAGRVTTIKNPYRGEVPTQTAKQNTAPIQVSNDSLTTAQNRIAGARGLEKSMPGQSFKGALKNAYKGVFKAAKGVPVEGMTFNGQPYTVDINSNVPGKVISDVNLTAGKLALLDNLTDVVRNGTYVGSGEYVQHGSKKKPALRYDYFETPVAINRAQYIAKFDVEVLPGANNYRTHQIVKMDLIPTGASLAGPTPAASPAVSSPSEGTRPLNVDSNITQGAENVKTQRQNDGLRAANAGSLKSDFQNLQAQSDTFHPEGANAARPVDVPTTNFEGRNIPKSASTVMGAQEINEYDVRLIEQQIADGTLAFDTIKDADAVSRAHQTILLKGFDGALEQYRQAANANVATKDNKALGQQLLLQASRGRNEAAISEILTLYTRNSTTVAQAMQAESILSKLSPEGQLLSVKRALNDLNSKYGTDVQLTEAEISDFLNADGAAARQKVREQILKRAAQSVPGTFRAKYDTLRYLGMLGNPRTHIRNILGNTMFQVPVMAKNRVGAVVEYAANRASGGKVERTKSITGANPFGKLAAEARADWKNAKGFLEQSSKYSEGQASLSAIEQHADAFSNENIVGRTVNRLSNANSALLEAEDTAAKKFIYSQSLASYLKANGVKSIEDADTGLLYRARNYAAQEALRNTFNDRNMLSDAAAKLGNLSRSDNLFVKGIGYVVEGEIPFKRTPANVVARGAEYNPIAGMVNAVAAVHNAKAGDMDAVARNLDRVAAGLSGTALMAAGCLAAGAGYVTGGEDEDDKQQDFDDLTGHQTYALELKDGTSVTLDWLAPAAIPFFMGAELFNAAIDGGLTLDDLWGILKNMSDPMLEMSMLQGLHDTAESFSYAQQRGDNPYVALIVSALTNYMTQVIPTLGGQIERVGETERMTTYTDKNSSIPTDWQYTVGKVSQKVPGWDYQQIPYIDAWGRTEETGSEAERIFNNFFNPAYVSQVDVDKVEQELQRVKDATGDSNVFPKRADRSFTVNGETKNLTADEYQKYAKALGQGSYTLVKDGLSLPAYQSMSDTEKADYISSLYKYATQTAKAEVSDYEPDSWVGNTMAAQKSTGLTPATVIQYRDMLSTAKENQGAAAANSTIREAIKNDSRLTTQQKNALDDIVLSDGVYLSKDLDVDYTSDETYIISQMSDGARKRWDTIKTQFGMSAEDYKQAWSIYQSNDLTASEKRVQISALGYNGSAVYSALGKKLS